MKSSFHRKDVVTLLFYCFYVMFATSVALIFQTIEFTDWIHLFFWIVISHIVFTFISFEITGVKLFSISGIFIALSYAFHFGQIIIKGLSQRYIYTFDVSLIVSQDIYINSVIFSLVFISLVSFGMMLNNISGRNKTIVVNLRHITREQSSCKEALFIGWVILLISMPVELYFSIIQLQISNQEGYLAALQVESSGILSQIANFHIIGIGLLLMGYSHRPYKSTFIFILYAIYAVITMLSGIRIYPLIAMIVLIYILYKSKNRGISFKSFIIYSVPTFFLIVLINTISEIREERMNSFDEVFTSFTNSLNNNPLLNILEEFGATIYTVSLTLIKVPVSIDYSYGTQFIKGIVTVLPNINGIFTNINDELTFTKFFNVSALGGSYIGEFYYSFGFYSLIFAPILGLIIQKVSNNFYNHLIKMNYIQAAYYTLPIFYLFVWVRGYYVGILRNSIWAALFIFLLYTFLVTFIRKKNVSLKESNNE